MGSLSSSNNAILVNKCQSLQNLTVSMQVTQDLITLGNNGFSLQLNCYPQTKPQATYQGKPLNWFQYVIAVEKQLGSVGDPVLVSCTQFRPTGFGFSPAKITPLIRLCPIESGADRLGDENCAPH